MKSFYSQYGKRWLDLYVAAALLLLLSPVLLAIALLVRIKLGPPILFAQVRPGLHGKPFTIYKFRTMRGACEPGNPLSDAERLTRFGQFLRSWSLDELPELWHVVRGDMSFVGPRPLLMQYLPLYTPQQRRRHDVRPGLTGWAQVNGRNAISWEQKFDYDIQYVDHLSLALDLKIVATTVVRVFRRDGISAQSHCTMPFFTGTESERDVAAGAAPEESIGRGQPTHRRLSA